MDDKKFIRTYKIESRHEEQLNMLEKLFQYIQYLGIMGSSREITIFVDGDGPVQLKFYKKREDNIFIKLDGDKTEKLPQGYGVIKTNEDGDEYYFDLG